MEDSRGSWQLGGRGFLGFWGFLGSFGIFFGYLGAFDGTFWDLSGFFEISWISWDRLGFYGYQWLQNGFLCND